MAKGIQTKKININDFSSANKEDISRIARSLNPFYDEVEKALRNTLSYEYITFTITVDASGIPVNSVALPISDVSLLKGFIAVSAVNSAGTFPTGSPFISYTINKNSVIITHVSGLPANTKFTLNILAVS